jgi:hypothetical protein
MEERTMSKKITMSLGICLVLVCFFAGCIKREFSNEKWRVTVVSFEFLEADGDYDNPFLKAECKNEPLAIHLKLDYIGPSGMQRIPDIFIREGLEKTSRPYIAQGMDGKCDKEKMQMLVKKEYYKEVEMKTGQTIFGKEGCILLFRADKSVDAFGLVVDDLQPILIEP